MLEVHIMNLSKENGSAFVRAQFEDLSDSDKLDAPTFEKQQGGISAGGQVILSKSNYMNYLRHPAWLWLGKRAKHKLPPVDDNTQAIFDAGHAFERIAEGLFPNGVRLGFNNYQEYKTLPQRTRDAISSSTKTIFQGRLEAGGITCIVDVLDRVEGDTFDLYEIKSSTKAKPEHEYDLAFQLEVLEKSGLTIRNISIVHVNNEYVREGEIDPKGLCSVTDVTEDIKRQSAITRDLIQKAFNVLSGELPDLSPRYANHLNISGTSWFQDWLEIYKTLVPELDEYSIYHLSYPNQGQIQKLEDAGFKLIQEVPEDYALRPKQVAQIQTTKSNQRIVDKEKIKEFINSFAYPIYFFDYETLSSLVPFFDGMQPYKDYPFQYSLHIIREPGKPAEHKEYLHREHSNPMPGLLEQLNKDIGSTGTVLAWYMSYEKRCNNTMADLYPQYKDFLDSMNQRMNDLMLPFSELWLVDKDFFGRASLKYVLPAMVPELSYQELNVQDGLHARRLWTQTILEGKHQEHKDNVLEALSEYCTLDTFAMVRILEELKKISSR